MPTTTPSKKPQASNANPTVRINYAKLLLAGLGAAIDADLLPKRFASDIDQKEVATIIATAESDLAAHTSAKSMAGVQSSAQKRLLADRKTKVSKIYRAAVAQAKQNHLERVKSSASTRDAEIAVATQEWNLSIDAIAADQKNAKGVASTLLSASKSMKTSQQRLNEVVRVMKGVIAASFPSKSDTALVQAIIAGDTVGIEKRAME